MADLTISVDIDARGTKKGADEAKSAVREIRNSIAGVDVKALGDKLKTAGSVMQQFGGQLRNIGTTMSIAVTAPLIALGTQVLKAGGEYERALNIFQSVTKATNEEMSRAARVAKELGADMTLPATSAKDAALAMNELGKAGLTATQSMDAAKGVLQLAAAGALDEARAAEIAANALNVFKLEASETTRVASLLAAAANASSAEVDDIALSMQQAGSSFAAARMPVEDMVTAIAALANAGIKGSDAGTSLKTFIQSLAAPSTKAKETMEELGVAVFDASGKMKQMPEIIGMFGAALSGLTDEQQAAALYKIFGSDAIRAAQILFRTGTDGFEKLKEQVTASGAAAELANARMKGLSGAWEGFKSQLETLGISIYEVIKAPLTQFLQNIATYVGQGAQAFEQMSPSIQQALIIFVAFIAALGPALVIIGSVVSAIGTIVTAFGALIGSASVIGVVGLAIAGLAINMAPVIASVATLYAMWQSNFAGIRDLTAVVVAEVSEIWAAFMMKLQELTAEILAEVRKFWQENSDQIIGIVQAFSELFKQIWTGMVAFWRENHETIKTVALAIWNVIKELIVSTIKVIASTLKLVLALINGDWSKAWEATKEILTAVVKAWVAIIETVGALVVGAVKIMFQSIWNLNTWIQQEAYKLGRYVGQGIIDGLMVMVDPVGTAARYLGQKAIDVLKDKFKTQSPSKVTHEIGKFVAEGLAEGMNDGGTKAAEAAVTLSQRIIGTLNTAFGGKIGDIIRNAFDVLGDSSKSWGDRLKTIFGGIAKNFRDMLTDMLSAWLNRKLGAGGGPGGTPNFNPGSGGGGVFGPGGIFGGGGTPLGGGNVPPTGTINANGEYVVNGNEPGSIWSQIFGPKTNILTGKDSKAGGVLGGIGSIANLIGGLVGGRTGTFLTNIGMGLQLGSMFGPWGAVAGAVIGAVASIFQLNSQRRKDEKTRNAAMGDALSTLRSQYDALISDVRTLRIDPASGIAQGTSIGAQVREQYMQMANGLKDGKTRRIALADVARIDALIAEKMAALRGVAEIAQGASDRDRRLIPEFANGVYMSPQFQAFRRYNGLLGGTWTGRDVVPALIAHKEMVLNPDQQSAVIRSAGRDVFKDANIPGYAGGTYMSAPTQMSMGDVNVMISIDQDADGLWHATAKSSNGRKVIASIVSDAHANDEIKMKRRGA